MQNWVLDCRYPMVHQSLMPLLGNEPCWRISSEHVSGYRLTII